MAGDHRIPSFRDRPFYLWMATFLATTTLVGFARTYYFRGYFHSPALRPFLHYHGAVMTAWIVLFVVQTLLIAGHRLRWHRALGYVGAVLAVLVVIMGSAATIVAAARAIRGHTTEEPLRLNVLALELAQMGLFAAFVGIALWQRRHTALHKRFMLLATLCMLPNPQIRMMPFLQSNLEYLLLWSAQVFLIIGIDALRNRQVHRGFLQGAVVANLALYLAHFGSQTAAWRQFAARLIT